MGNFSDGFWNLFLFVVTVVSIGGLALFVFTQSKGKMPAAGSSAETTGHVWDDDLRELNNPLPAWWRNMFYITLAFGALYLLFYPGLGSNSMFLGWTQITQYEEEMAEAEATYGPLFARFENEPIEALAGNEDALKMGERLYASYCTQCHGSDAGGVRGYPNLRDGDWLWGGTPDRIQESILKGRQAVMPAWEAVLKDEGIKQVTQYILSLGGREHDAAAAAQGKPLFASNCVACHGAEGEGNPMLGAANLSDDVWLYGGSPKAIEATLRDGRNGIMPAHEEFLGKAKVHLLTAYIYSLANK
jgi:cytochrome c oxidase cbb3-type subunit 3